MRISEETIQAITEKISIVDIVSNYVSLKQKGKDYWGLCPFHSEKTPSFSVSEEKNMYYCFGCHKGGTVINFLMEMEHHSFVEAVQALGSKAGIHIAEDSIAKSQGDSKRKVLLELNNRLSNTFHYLIYNSAEGEKALHYLASRGISEDTIKKYMIGYAPSDRMWLFSFLTKKGYTEIFLKESGIFSLRYPKISLFCNRIIFPIFNVGGEVVAFGGRTIDKEGFKYINSPETILYSKKRLLYGLRQALADIKKENCFYIVEGYFDVLAMYQAGVTAVVAPLGTSFTPEQTALLKRYASKGVFVFDNDQAGYEASKKGLIFLEKEGVDAYVVDLGTGSDPAEIMQKEGREALQKIVKYPINSFEYLLNREIRDNKLHKSEGKESVLRKIAPYISAIQSNIRKEECLQYLADRLEVDFLAIKNDYKRLTSVESKQLSRNKENELKYKNSETAKELSPELFLMVAVVVNRSFFAYVRSMIKQEDISDPWAREIYLALEEAYRNDEVSVDRLFERINDNRLKKVLINKISSEEYGINVEQLIKDGVKQIKILSLDIKRQAIIKKIKKADQNKVQTDSITELLFEKIYLDEELNKLRVADNDGTPN